MRNLCVLTVLAVCVGCIGCRPGRTPLAIEVEREVVRIASERSLWPDYEPLTIPLAVFDGSDTYLFRHPDPPPEFQEADGMFVLEGRHPMVVANTSATIGGVRTATLIVSSTESDLTVTDIAAVALHEGFHVFQASTGRTWGADETHLFVYPVDEGDLLALRRLETEALRRALEAADRDSMAGWARVALDMRNERFNHLDPVFRAYERGIEALEGSATYVEYKATGEGNARLPREGFHPERVRYRAYAAGVAFALLLDAFDPGWQGGFAEHDSLELDILLAEALEAFGGGGRYAFTDSLKAGIVEAARRDADKLVARWRERREDYQTEPGWQVVVEAAEGSPLWPQGFDPMNIRRVEGGLLHTRFLRLGNEAGNIEVMGDTVLTEGVGPHPLFNGVKRLVLTGLETEPVVVTSDGELALDLSSFTADFRGAEFTTSDRRILIRLGAM